MLLNLTNHPSDTWSPEQIAAAGGDVMDMPFPSVPPEADEAYIDALANEYLDRILSLENLSAVHIMGEFNFCYALISRLKAQGVRCVASTTLRETVEENGVKISKFKFTRFREYAK